MNGCVNSPVHIISGVLNGSCSEGLSSNVHVCFHVKTFLQIPHNIVDILLEVCPSVMHCVSSVRSKLNKEKRLT